MRYVNAVLSFLYGAPILWVAWKEFRHYGPLAIDAYLLAISGLLMLALCAYLFKGE